MLDGLVSIIMPSWNTGEYIGESIQSVINQSYDNWELIIVDDCSNDNTDDVVGSYLTDMRIRYYKNEKNIGAALTRNRALREAKGKWVAFLDSDDLWTKDKLEKQIRYMKINDCDFSYTKYSEINEHGNFTGVVVSGPSKITKRGMFRYCWPGCLTVMYNQEKIGLIQIEEIKKNNDYAMWLKVCKKADCYFIDENLAFYRRGRSGSVSTSSKMSLILWHYKLFREAESLGIINSMFCTIRNIIYGLYKKKRYVERN